MLGIVSFLRGPLTKCVLIVFPRLLTKTFLCDSSLRG